MCAYDRLQNVFDFRRSTRQSQPCIRVQTHLQMAEIRKKTSKYIMVLGVKMLCLVSTNHSCVREGYV